MGPTGDLVYENSPVITVPPHPVTGSTDGVKETMLDMIHELAASQKQLIARMSTMEAKAIPTANVPTQFNSTQSALPANDIYERPLPVVDRSMMFLL